MRNTLILAATAGALACGFTSGASAVMATGAAFKQATAAPEGLLQDVRLRRTCSWTRGKQRCVWKNVRDRGKYRHGKKWRWRKNNRGIRIRIFI